MRRARSALLLAVGLAALVVGKPASAAPGWSLRVGGVSSNYDRQRVLSYGGSVSRLDMGSGSGPQAAAELRIHPRFGLELSAAQLELDAHYRVSLQVPISFDPFILGEETVYEADGSYTLRPLAAAALFHLFPGRRVDVYLGPQVARVDFDVGVPGLGDRKYELAYGGKAGVEVRLGDGPWAAAAEIGQLEIQHESSDHDVYGNIGLSTASVLLVFRGR